MIPVSTTKPFSKAAARARRLLSEGVPASEALSQAGLPLDHCATSLALKIQSIIAAGKTDKEKRKELVTSRLVQFVAQDADMELSRKAAMDLAKIDGMYQEGGGINANFFELHPETRAALDAAGSSGPLLDVRGAQEESAPSDLVPTGNS